MPRRPQGDRASVQLLYSAVKERRATSPLFLSAKAKGPFFFLFFKLMSALARSKTFTTSVTPVALALCSAVESGASAGPSLAFTCHKDMYSNVKTQQVESTPYSAKILQSSHSARFSVVLSNRYSMCARYTTMSECVTVLHTKL